MQKFLTLRFYVLAIFGGAGGFTVLGYIVKLIPNFYWGMLMLLAFVNVITIYLMLNYPELKEQCWFVFLSQVLALGIVWLA